MKLTGQSPDEVRSWDYEDLLGLLAYCELENEEHDERLAQIRAQTGAPSRTHQRAPAGGPTTTVYRFKPRTPPPKR
ncbi:hypothetical protein [Corallococcus sp. AS-1-6]|uniref:hypothetical protein n=1 Tax=Corallococcus sp. AS-1-6 TaxID=2874599 RepID=UPI001CBB2913|nr:hypothetical protein [Corallococcus sp. AS-1-6]MBZ4371485.1 hypothetical protein [Corallococcus sp. AS-1-6]